MYVFSFLILPMAKDIWNANKIALKNVITMKRLELNSIKTSMGTEQNFRQGQSCDH